MTKDDRRAVQQFVGIRQLSLDHVTASRDVHCRFCLNESTIKTYSERMKMNDRFPPVVVFEDEDTGTFWLADGYHRFEAHRVLSYDVIDCLVKRGSKRDAIAFGISVNMEHGLHRSNSDKKHCVLLHLRDDEWSLFSNTEIATRCGVSKSFVSKIKAELSRHGGKINPEYEGLRLVSRGDSKYYMRVSKIGGRAEKPKQELAQSKPVTQIHAFPPVPPRPMPRLEPPVEMEKPPAVEAKPSGKDGWSVMANVVPYLNVASINGDDPQMATGRLVSLLKHLTDILNNDPGAADPNTLNAISWVGKNLTDFSTKTKLKLAERASQNRTVEKKVA